MSKHGSFAKTCPTYVKEKEIVGIKTRERIPYRDARAKYFRLNPLGKRAFATVARSTTTKDKGNPPNQESPLNKIKKTSPQSQMEDQNETNDIQMKPKGNDTVKKRPVNDKTNTN
jgi:hypothetical protein